MGFDRFLLNLVKKIDFQRNLKGIGKEFNWFPKEIQKIWKVERNS